jgi:PhzF family phenazine biosynthesis protein
VAEVDLCGHATIATFNLLKQKEIIKEGFYKQETKAGVLELAVKPNAVFMEQPAPIFGEILEPKDISSAFLNKGYIHPNLPIQICSTGIREIFLPVKDVETLNSLEMDREEMIELSIKHNVIGLHAFALSEDCDAYGRNFAPYLGIDEESATGTSNGALSCYLNKYVSSKYKFILRQGYSMNLPSEIIGKLETEKDVIKKVWVGGTAKIIEE